MKNFVLKYAIFGSFVMCTGVVIPLLIEESLAHNDYGELLGYLAMILGLSAIYFGTRHYNSTLQEPMTFRQAFSFGTLINFTTAMVFGLFSFVLYQWVMPDFLQAYLDQSLTAIASRTDLTAEQMAAEMAYMNDNKDLWLSPSFGGLLMFGTVFPIGLVITLITSLVLRQKHHTS